MSRELLQVIVAVEAGAMTVAEVEPQSVIADTFPPENLHLGKIGFLIPAILLTEDIAFTAGFGTRRGGAKFRGGNIRFGAVAPNEGELRPDDLNVPRCIQRENEPSSWPVVEKRKLSAESNQ